MAAEDRRHAQTLMRGFERLSNGWEALSMTTLKTASGVLAFSMLALAHGAVPVRAGGSAELRVAPLKAINLDVGAKHAIGYYLAEQGNCNLTVLLTDVSYDGDGTTPSATRVNVNVAAGTSAKVDMIDGTTMQFTCAAGASDMTVKTFARYADSPVLLKGVATK
jgi:hypothetical protein